MFGPILIAAMFVGNSDELVPPQKIVDEWLAEGVAEASHGFLLKASDAALERLGKRDACHTKRLSGPYYRLYDRWGAIEDHRNLIVRKLEIEPWMTDLRLEAPQDRSAYPVRFVFVFLTRVQVDVKGGACSSVATFSGDVYDIRTHTRAIHVEREVSLAEKVDDGELSASSESFIRDLSNALTKHLLAMALGGRVYDVTIENVPSLKEANRLEKFARGIGRTTFVERLPWNKRRVTFRLKTRLEPFVLFEQFEDYKIGGRELIVEDGNQQGAILRPDDD